MANDKKKGSDNGDGQGPHEIAIHIDKKEYKSPSPTTGEALYVLGGVQSGYELFREVHGQGDDEPIANNSTSIELKPGDHFYSAQTTLNPGR